MGLCGPEDKRLSIIAIVPIKGDILQTREALKQLKEKFKNDDADFYILRQNQLNN